MYIETIDHEKVNETCVAEIIQNKIYCGKCTYLEPSINAVI